MFTIDLDEIEEQPLDADAMKRMRNQLVCVLPEGLVLSEESWALVDAEFRLRRDRGDAEPMLSPAEVLEIVGTPD